MKIDPKILKEASVYLLEPYSIPADCPYISEDQRELGMLAMEDRAAGMEEWLLLVSPTDEEIDAHE